MMEAMEKENRKLTDDEIGGYLQTAADMINESIIRCKETVFIRNLIGVLSPNATPEIVEAIPEMSPERLELNGRKELIGIFSMINEAYQQLMLMHIHNNTEPENVEDVLNNHGIQMGNIHDGLKMALECRYRVFREYQEIADMYEKSLN